MQRRSCKYTLRGGLLFSVAMVLLTAPAQTAQAAPASLGWSPGEDMTYVLLLGPFEVGRAAVAVGRPGPFRGQRVVRVRGRAETKPTLAGMLPLRQELRATLALRGLLPVHSKLFTRRGKQNKTTTTEHRTRGNAVTKQSIVKGKRKHARARRLPRKTRGPIGALLLLRGQRLRRGDRSSLMILSGSKLYRLDLTVKGHERVSVGRDKRRAIRLEGTLRDINDRGHPVAKKKARPTTLWLSADRSRVPLQLHMVTGYGPLTLKLSRYRPPTQKRPS